MSTTISTVYTMTDEFIAQLNANFAAATIISGTITAGNVPVFTASGIEDSGVALLTTLPARTVWGNNSSSTAVPAALTVLTMGNGTVSAPTYSFNASAGSGMYSPAADQVAVSASGNKLVQMRSGDATSFMEYIYSGAVFWRAQGGTNVDAVYASNGTGEVSLRSNGGATNGFMFRASPSGSAGDANNYLRVTTGATGNGPVIAPVAQGTSDTNIDVVLTTVGTGTLKFGNSTGSIAANASVATVLGSVGPSGSHTTVQEWLVIKNASGTARYIPCF